MSFSHDPKTHNVIKGILLSEALTCMKGALAWYGKLTWESAHAWILKILCYLIVWGITLILMVRLCQRKNKDR